MTIEKVALSGLTDGIPLLITGTNTAGAQTVHTAHATKYDRVTLYAWNSSASDVDLTLEVGGTSSPIVVTIPAKSAGVPLPDIEITNSTVIEAFAGTGSVIRIGGPRVIRGA